MPIRLNDFEMPKHVVKDDASASPTFGPAFTMQDGTLTTLPSISTWRCVTSWRAAGRDGARPRR